MNNLSWFLYGAGVVENVKGPLAFWMFAFSCLFVIGLIVLLICTAVKTSGNERDKKAMDGFLPSYTKVYRWVICGWLLSTFLVVVTPQKQTLYLMAGSELGEAISKSEVANEAYEALRAWLRSQTEGKK